MTIFEKTEEVKNWLDNVENLPHPLYRIVDQEWLIIQVNQARLHNHPLKELLGNLIDNSSVIRMFGSFMPMSEKERDKIVEETYPMFLESIRNGTHEIINTLKVRINLEKETWSCEEDILTLERIKSSLEYLNQCFTKHIKNNEQRPSGD